MYDNDKIVMIPCQVSYKKDFFMEHKILSKYAASYDRNKFKSLNREMNFAEYLEEVNAYPLLGRNAFQYIRSMILEAGTEEIEVYRKTYKKYKFFNDPLIPIFGLTKTLNKIVDFIDGAAGGFGTQKRVLLLHGPVGTSKSTICRRIKKGLEDYSRTDNGRWFTFRWKDIPEDLYNSQSEECPMHEDPLRLMPIDMRRTLFADLNEVIAEQFPGEYPLVAEGGLCPFCDEIMTGLLAKYDGDWGKVVENHVQVVRKVHDESRRVGIGTFQPKDEKNQDATELSGDINYRKIGDYGKDSDPRAFNFDGEFQVANRGMIEFIEALKLEVAFLYDLLGASQEHSIKPKKFAQVNIDEFIVGHTNLADFDKLRNNPFMEALRDRTVKIDVPYLTEWADEIQVYMNDYGPGKIKQHLMPHTLEIAAFFAILTRMHDDKDRELDLRDKVKLYDGHSLPNWSEDSVKELRDKYPEEGLKGGLSARFIQDAISNCLARYKDYVNIFHVFNELKEKIDESSSFGVEDKKKYLERLDLAEKELQEILKNEVQRALVADENVIVRIYSRYIDNVVAYVNDEKIINPITKKEQKPDEILMRSIEEKIDIHDNLTDDFRKMIVGFIGGRFTRNQEVRWNSNPELKRALEAKLFEDTKDSIKISSLTAEAAACDPDMQDKIEAIKTRLIKQSGYNQQSATDVLDYVASIFSRGSASE